MSWSRSQLPPRLYAPPGCPSCDPIAARTAVGEAPNLTAPIPSEPSTSRTAPCTGAACDAPGWMYVRIVRPPTPFQATPARSAGLVPATEAAATLPTTGTLIATSRRLSPPSLGAKNVHPTDVTPSGTMPTHVGTQALVRLSRRTPQRGGKRRVACLRDRTTHCRRSSWAR